MLEMNSIFLNYFFAALSKKCTIPSNFHSQAAAIKELMCNDVSGLVDSLTDFQVSAANVNWYIKTGNPTLDSIMEQWLDSINSEFNGKVPSGIKALASEYYKERWKGASFPILKILAWGEVEGFKLPTKMAFVDGSIVRSDSRKNIGDSLELGENSYYLGSNDDKLDKGCIITKPFGRWFDEYPKIYLIKNGVYYNWKLLNILKDKQGQVLDQVMPYLLQVLKGTPELAIKKNVNYSDDKLKKVVDQMEELMEKMNDAKYSGTRKTKTPIRASQFDEEIKHLIPDLKTILATELSTGFEKSILTGMGFIDVADAVSSNRKESILNPKALIQEVRAGIGEAQDGSGFAQVLKDLTFIIKKQNEGRAKYNNLKMQIQHSKPQIFMDKEYRDFLLSMFNRGKLSQKTLVEVAGDQVYEEELEQRKREAKSGAEFFLYPPVVQNQEAAGGNDYLGSKNADPEKDIKVPQEKLGPDAQMKYNKSSVIADLETAVYRSINTLPAAVKEGLPNKKERAARLALFYFENSKGDIMAANSIALPK